MKLFTFSNFGLSTLLFAVIQTPVLSINIDTFIDNTSQNITVPEGGSGIFQNLKTELINTETIGGQRYIELTTTGSNSQAFTTLNVGSGIVDLSTATGVTSAISFLWDGGDSLNQDLTVGGHDSFGLQILEIDQAVTLNFLVTDTNDNLGTITRSINNIGNYQFLYSQASGVDFESVKSIRLYTSNEPQGLDFRFDYLETAQAVPFEFSPALGILLNSGFFSFIFLKKKFQKKIDI